VTFRPMKPQTIARRKAKRTADRAKAKRERIKRLAEMAEQHFRAGDLRRAAHYAEMFVDEVSNDHGEISR